MENGRYVDLVLLPEIFIVIYQRCFSLPSREIAEKRIMNALGSMDPEDISPESSLFLKYICIRNLYLRVLFFSDFISNVECKTSWMKNVENLTHPRLFIGSAIVWLKEVEKFPLALVMHSWVCAPSTLHSGPHQHQQKISPHVYFQCPPPLDPKHNI